MARFSGKKLPTHWVYVPSRRQVRDRLRAINAKVRVSFDGTGWGESPVGLLLGYLEQRVADGKWCFYLRLWGVPEASVSQQSDSVARLALTEIERSIVECLALPAAETMKPTQLLLRFIISTDQVTSRSSVEPVDQFSFSSGKWWIDD